MTRARRFGPPFVELRRRAAHPSRRRAAAAIFCAPHGPGAWDNRRAGLTPSHALGACLIIAALRKSAVSRQPRNTLVAYRFRCRPVAAGRADLVRKMNQFAKKHFRREAAFLFSH
jgi:hypothetical protein